MLSFAFTAAFGVGLRGGATYAPDPPGMRALGYAKRGDYRHHHRVILYAVAAVAVAPKEHRAQSSKMRIRLLIGFN